MKLKKEKRKDEKGPSLFRKISAHLFLDYINKRKKNYKKAKKEYSQANMTTIFEIYLASIYLASIIIFFVSVLIISLIVFLLKYPILHSITFAVLVSLPVTIVSFFVFDRYPKFKGDSLKQSIDANLPFAIIYMSGVAESGVPPQNIFKLLSKAEGFGELGNEAKYITYLMEKRNFGLLNALSKCASRTPSQSLKEFLLSMVMTIKYGGDIELFLKTEANRKEIDYRLKAKEYQEKLSMYSTMYTGLFIAAPVLFISMFSLMNFFSPIGGIEILEQIVLFGLPMVNIIYIYYLHITQPQI